MSRYIEADVLKANCDIVVGNTTIGRRDYVMFHEIDSAPSIDIVFCKECMHQAKQTLIQGEIYDMPCCKKGMRISNDNGFCSYGEREDL